MILLQKGVWKSKKRRASRAETFIFLWISNDFAPKGVLRAQRKHHFLTFYKVDCKCGGPRRYKKVYKKVLRASTCPPGPAASEDRLLRPSACPGGRAASQDGLLRPSACPLGRAASRDFPKSAPILQILH